MSSDSLESFEEMHYDEYEYYNLADYPAHSGGKGKSKKEMGRNTNRHCPAGHERKITEKLYNSELKRKRARSLGQPCDCSSSPAHDLTCTRSDAQSVEASGRRTRVGAAGTESSSAQTPSIIS
uniref:nuclear protein 1b n=1 Tax=Pristiophorus japonicus TaxID=55135 RepID=UPI00398E4771